MNDVQKKLIKLYREAGYGYSKIAKELGVSVDTVKSYCRRHGLGGVAANPVTNPAIELCPACGEFVKQNPGRKKKRFCSDKCRMQWWNSHADQVKKRAIYHFVCPYCQQNFISYGNKNRKYCSHACYILDRFGEKPENS